MRSRIGASASSFLGVLAFAKASMGLVWGPETNLSNTGTDSETGLGHRVILESADGALHIAWAEKDSPKDQYRIYTRRLEGTLWTPSELVVDYLASDPGEPGDNIGAKYPSLAATPDGSLHLFWHDYRVAGIANVEIFTKTRPTGGAWDLSRAQDVRLTNTSHSEVLGDNGYVPVPAASEDGALHVLWYDFRFDGFLAEILSKTRLPGGSWDLTPGDSADIRVTTDAANSELVDAAIDSEGDVHAAWRSVDAGACVRYARRDGLSGVWTQPVTLDAAAAVQGAPCVAVDGQDRVHVVWPDARDGGRALYTRVVNPDGSLSAEERLTSPAGGADEPSLASSADGALHLVWHDGRVSLLNREVFYRRKAAATPWDTTTASDFRVSNGTGSSVRPSVFATAARVAIVWKDARDGNHEVYFRQGRSEATAAELEAGREEIFLAYPNPFRDHLILAIPGPWPAREISIFDLAGRRVRALRVADGRTVWDARAESGELVAPGRYWILAGETARSVTVLR